MPKRGDQANKTETSEQRFKLIGPDSGEHPGDYEKPDGAHKQGSDGEDKNRYGFHFLTVTRSTSPPGTRLGMDERWWTF